jgi:cytoskeletal protein CcmA (bactofilin family)
MLPFSPLLATITPSLDLADELTPLLLRLEDARKTRRRASAQPFTVFQPGDKGPHMQGSFESHHAQSQESVIGKSIVIKGEIAASGPLYVYGRVEGLINAPAHRVTVGENGKVKADVSAREIVILGSVRGNLDGGHRVEIRGNGSLTGNLTADRLSVEEGAVLQGSIEVREKQSVAAHEEVVSLQEHAESDRAESDFDRRAWETTVVP